MSRLFPHPPYAEDQPLSTSILTTHVLTRGIQVGSLAGTFAGTSLLALRHFSVLSRPKLRSSARTTLLRSTGVGALTGFALLAIGLRIQMYGKEDIEWKDRSWRLLENKGQLECDDWTYPAMLAGGLAAMTRARVWGWRGVLGGVGAGSLLGMAGSIGWRHGVKGGKWEEDVV
ncbi:hypothetical protein VTL71DRAFT_10105 [Oculimacula yallundae]|uniref:Uncharacterized protein n=1 Tax=Oculimacula yallundae TaxID=86028 RepID=A0ABR4BQD9_9HELO